MRITSFTIIVWVGAFPLVSLAKSQAEPMYSQPTQLSLFFSLSQTERSCSWLSSTFLRVRPGAFRLAPSPSTDSPLILSRSPCLGGLALAHSREDQRRSSLVSGIGEFGSEVVVRSVLIQSRFAVG